MIVLPCLILLGAATMVSSVNVTIDEVALHNSQNDCWSAVYGRVYDLTAYAPNHRRGGGPSRVYDMCGIDGTSLYDPVHGNTNYLSTISSIVNIGPLVAATKEPTPAPTPPPAVPTSPPATPSPTLAPTNPPTLGPTTAKPNPPTDPPTIAPTDPPVTPTPTNSISQTPEPSEFATLPPTATSPPPLNSTEPPEPTISIEGDVVINLATLATHNVPDDCWVSYYGTGKNL